MQYQSAFGISEEVLSKHILLVGGTGSGKTNLFYHIVKQLKSKMTADDVMLIFDSKGDFHKKFYSKGGTLPNIESNRINGISMKR